MITLLLTGSRTGLLILALVVGSHLVALACKRPTRWLAATMTLTFCLAAAPLLFRFDVDWSEGRGLIWAAGTRPLGDASLVRTRSFGVAGSKSSTHLPLTSLSMLINQLLDSLFTTGLVGATCLLIAWGCLSIKAISHPRRYGRAGALYSGRSA